MTRVNVVLDDAMAFANRGNSTRRINPSKDKEHRIFGRHMQGLFRDEFEEYGDECAKKAGVSVGTTALVGPLLSDRQYQFIGFLVSVPEVSMPVSVLFHVNHMLYAVAGALCI
jgi:hypothetical protein